jgi:hypothetical protein
VKSRKDQKYENLVAQEETHRRFEAVDEPEDAGTAAIAASEQRYDALMTGPSENVPEWARVVVNDPSKVTGASTTDREDVKVALARLDAEEKELTRKLNEGLERRRAILNQQLADQKAAEERIEREQELPSRMSDVLAEVRAYRETQALAPTTPERDLIQEGKDALNRAMRRSHGEKVDEPESVAYAPVAVPQESALQLRLKARIAPALAEASERRAEIKKWSSAVGRMFDDLYVSKEDPTPREHQLIETLMRGMAPTQANLGLVTGLLYAVRSAVDVKASMERTLEEQARALTQLVERANQRGPMQVQNDFSVEYYDLERELAVGLRDLRTVTSDGIESLWVAAKEIERRLSVIAKTRTQNAGVPQKPLEWENRGEILAGAVEAKRREKNDGLPTVKTDEGWGGLNRGDAR